MSQAFGLYRRDAELVGTDLYDETLVLGCSDRSTNPKPSATFFLSRKLQVGSFGYIGLL